MLPSFTAPDLCYFCALTIDGYDMAAGKVTQERFKEFPEVQHWMHNDCLMKSLMSDSKGPYLFEEEDK